MEKNSGIARLIVFIILGLVLGGILGEALGAFFGQIGVMAGAGVNNPVSTLFVAPFEFGYGINQSEVIDLYMVKLRLGLSFKFNFCSFIGLFASLYIMKWSR